MNLRENIKSSFINIFSHPLRSLLTLLGISIGVFAVVTMFSSVQGIKLLIKSNMEGMGWNNSITIHPSSGNESRGRRFRHFYYMRRKQKPLTYSDFEVLRKEIDYKYIYGLVNDYSTFYHNEKEFRISLKATNIDFFQAKTYNLVKGRFFNDYEMKNARKVCIVGSGFIKEYYKKKDIINKKLTIGGNRYKVIGILGEDKLNSNGFNFNKWERQRELRSVFIPLTTGAIYLRNNEAVDYIYMQAKNEKVYNNFKNRAYQTLLAEHNMAHDFSFSDVGDFMMKINKEIDDFMKKWNITLFSIASISLLVGGIGLFSTLLISITERMKEIGIRKSIGATDFDIFVLFILEALILAILAALSGIIISSILIQIIASLLKTSFPIPTMGILIGLGFSILIGILSGLYPAIKAASLDPVRAIYYRE